MCLLSSQPHLSIIHLVMIQLCHTYFSFQDPSCALVLNICCSLWNNLSFSLSFHLCLSPSPLPLSIQPFLVNSSFRFYLKFYFEKVLGSFWLGIVLYTPTASHASTKATTTFYCNCLFNFLSVFPDTKLFYAGFICLLPSLSIAPKTMPNLQQILNK